MTDLKTQLQSKSHAELVQLVLSCYDVIHSKSELQKQTEAVVKQQGEMIKALQQEIVSLKEQLENLKDRFGNDHNDPPKQKQKPDWVKANTPQKETDEKDEPKKQRTKRTQNFTFRRQEPTKTIDHYYDNCPECNRHLPKGSEYSRRQVIEIPIAPAQIIDHVVREQYCGRCNKTYVRPVDFTPITGGGGHYGVDLISLVATLKINARVAIGTIQDLLKSVYRVEISAGSITEMLHRVAKTGKQTYDQLQNEVRNSFYVHADETGWRENGQNGYIWSFSTPTTRFLTYSHSRAHNVPEGVLGSPYKGILISDFFSAYSYHLGEHQRCWVHFWRDVKELKRNYPKDLQCLQWLDRLHDIYRSAKEFSSSLPQERKKARLRFEFEAVALATPYAKSCLPQSTLAKRVLQFEKELFTFVEHPEIPSENNAAERSVRPCVIARKMCGGTRSEKGSKTTMTLMSLFYTWKLRLENGFQNCRELLKTSQ